MSDVSVIIPVYNGEKYLAECLESVVTQTLEDIEIVCVNDGSSDGSSDILAEFAHRDARIATIDQENAGLSAARNAGVQAAHGDYIQFLDADDFLEQSTLERLYERASREDLDVLYFDAVPFFECDDLEVEHASYKTYYHRSREYPGVMSGAELLTQMTLENDYRPSACLQLIRTEYYRRAGLSFIRGLLHEDNPFTFECALRARRVGYEPQPFYHRRIREGSIMTVERGLDHFQGFFVGYLAMLRFSIRGDFEPRTSSAIARLCDQMYRQALKILVLMSPEEREAITLIDSRPEALHACALLTRDADAILKTQDLKRKLKAAKRKLESVRSSRSYRFAQSIRRLLGKGK